MNICSLLLLSASIGIQPNANSWRDVLGSRIQTAYQAGGILLSVSRDALYSPVIASMSSDGVAALRVVEVRWDALHHHSVVLLETKGAHPLVAQSSERLPPWSRGRVLITEPAAPLMVKAGERCEAAISEGKLHMKFETKALNSGRMGQKVRVQMTEERRKILRAVVVGPAQVEVLP